MGTEIMDLPYGHAIGVGGPETRMVRPGIHHRRGIGIPMLCVRHDDPLTRLVQEGPTVSSAEHSWTPISDASGPLGSYVVDPAVYGVPLPSRSQASSESWATSTDAGEIWRPDGFDGANYMHLQRRSASPTHETAQVQRQKLGGDAAKESLAFQNLHISNHQAYSWPLDGGSLKPYATSPGMFTPQDRMSSGEYSAPSSGIRTGGHYDLGTGASGAVVRDDGLLREPPGPRSHRGPSQSPLSTSVTLNDPHASVSPTPRVLSLSPSHDASKPVNPKRPKVRRKAHNAIEKRYRVRLNDKIAELRESIPALRVNATPHVGGIPGDAELGIGCEGGGAHKVNKAHVLEKATEYIKSLERCNRRLQADLHRALSLPRHQANHRPGQPLFHPFSLDPGVGSPHAATLGGTSALDSGAYMNHMNHDA